MNALIRCGALVALLTVGLGNPALALRIVVEAPGEPGVEGSLCVSGAGRELMRQELALPWQGYVVGSPQEELELSTTAPGFWPCQTRSAGGQAEIRIKMVRQGKIRGRLRLPNSTDSLPASLLLRLETPRKNGQRAEVVACTATSIEVRCPVADDGKFECPAPAGMLSLRAAAADYVPFYFWDVGVSAKTPLDLDTLILRRGASIVGFLEGENVDFQETKVRADRDRYGWSNGDEEAKLERMQVEALPNKNLFFQLTGLAPGRYVLTAKAGNLISAEMTVTLADAEEVVLGESLELLAPLEATFFVEPRVAPKGESWRAVLQREIAGRTLDLEEKEVSLQGEVILKGLKPGAYRLELRDAMDSIWHKEEFELDSSRNFFLALDLIEVHGKLLMGEGGRPGKVVFGANRVPHIAFEANEEGIFEGFLPHDGEWPLLVEWPSGERRQLPPIEVRRAGGKSWARVEIVFPATRIDGWVTRDGKNVDASILVRRPGTSELLSNILTEEGNFELLGLEAGRYEISAVNRKERSPWQEVEVREKMEAPRVHLEIGTSMDAYGLLRQGGQAVPGAFMVARKAGDRQGWEGMLLKATSQADGKFSLPVPKENAHLEMLILAPGLPIWLGKVTLGEAQNPGVIQLPLEGGNLAFAVAAPADWIVRFAGAEISLESLLSVMAQFQGGFQQRAGDHAFLANGLAAGLWALCRASSPAECSDGWLQPGMALDLAPPAYSAEFDHPFHANPITCTASI